MANLRFWHREGHEVSNNIRNALVEEFGFEPEVAGRMPVR